MQAQRPGDILVVDGDEISLNAITDALRVRGHAVDSCSTAQNARRLLENKFYDVMVCAHRLPDQRGEVLCNFVKADETVRNTFVALVLDMGLDSAEAGAILARQYSSDSRVKTTSGPDDIILKPILPDMLAGRVTNLLRMRRYLDESANAIGTLMAVAEGIEEQDRRSRGHCKRLAVMCVELGSCMGCDEWELSALERGAYLHDIGMVTVSGSLTQRNGILSPAEMESIKAHTVRGEQLCKPVAALQSVLPIIRWHHERMNGTGYPDRLRSEKIPRLVQIFIIPHLYEALRVWRPYRSAVTESRALMMMEEEVNLGHWGSDMFRTFKHEVVPGLDERLDSMHILWPTS
jgi:putative two-component system response regulator